MVGTIDVESDKREAFSAEIQVLLENAPSSFDRRVRVATQVEMLPLARGEHSHGTARMISAMVVDAPRLLSYSRA
ncbi:MAG: hypothetical protein JO356_17230 [Acidobacteria bacterium]|nr:hypothetical protein [Acidobacteriota bacterium]